MNTGFWRLVPTILIVSCVGGPTKAPEPDTDEPDDTSAPLADGWSFVPVDGMVCGNGSSTGIGVSPGSDPSQLVVFLAGGGACWDGLTCFVLSSASHIDHTWGEADLRAETAWLDRSGLLDRDDSANSARAATYAYLPYCTGDLHLGQSTRAHDVFNPARITHHAGHTNLIAALRHLKSIAPAVSKVWVIGQSAGGYGAQLQADQFSDAWPDASLRVFADGAPLVHPYGTRWSEMSAAWEPRLAVEGTLPEQLAAHRLALPEVPFALTTHRDDLVITLYFNYPAGALGPAHTGLLAGYDADLAGAAFALDGPDHTMLGTPDRWEGPDGTTVRDWFTAWRDGAALVEVR